MFKLENKKTQRNIESHKLFAGDSIVKVVEYWNQDWVKMKLRPVKCKLCELEFFLEETRDGIFDKEGLFAPELAEKLKRSCAENCIQDVII